MEPQGTLEQLQLAAGPGPVELHSHLHGSLGTFDSRQQAQEFAAKVGVPLGTSTRGSGFTGYFLKPIPIKPSS